MSASVNIGNINLSFHGSWLDWLENLLSVRRRTCVCECVCVWACMCVCVRLSLPTARADQDRFFQ